MIARCLYPITIASGGLGIDVFVADQLEVLSGDSAGRLFVNRLIGKTGSLVLILRSDSLNQHLDVARAAVGLQGFA